jgi:hypothetical protein
MADRILVWYIPGVLSNNVEGINISTEYTLDKDYVPVRVTLRQKEAQSGEPNVFDINDDGVSLFGDVKPSINQGLKDTEWTVFASNLTVIQKDSVITLDADQISGATPGKDLTVQLDLMKV